MALLMFRTFGVIIVSFIVLIMYVLHRKKNGKFIKRKAVNEEEKIKYQKSHIDREGTVLYEFLYV